MNTKPTHIFIGHYVNALKVMHHKLGVDLVIVEPKDSNREVLKFCSSHQIPFATYTRAELNNISSFQLCLVASFGCILPNTFINKGGYVVNLHPGDIAKVRGRHPLPQAILNHNHFMGITAHLIEDEKVDDGPIIRIDRIPIDYTASYMENNHALVDLVPGLTHYIIERFQQGDLASSVRIPIRATDYYPPLPSKTLQNLFSSETLSDWAPGS